jgi:two-component system phosphate regulon sensor histidine kinase PhoR
MPTHLRPIFVVHRPQVKTSAFVIRVAICFLLSLIPLKDFENRIYSARMSLRAHWGELPPVVIVDGTAPAALSRAFTLPADTSPELLVDSDSTVLRSVLLPKMAPPSIAYRAYAKQGMDLAKLRHPEAPHLINYAGPAGTFSHCQLSARNCPPLADKIAIFTDDSDTAPLLRTPLGPMSRAEIVANDVATVIARKPIYEAGWIERVLLILAMILMGAFYIIYYPVLISALAVTGTGVAVVLVLFQIVFQLFDIYIPSANIGGSLLITYLIFTGYRLAFQDNLQWRSLKQAQYARELDQMKSNFLSLVSHDLKTPLAKIQAQVERLKREKPELGEALESIENSNNELKHYITSIINLSKIESQKVILNKKSNDINQLIQQALKRLRPLSLQKAITIEERLDPLFSVECDEDLMRQVLTNLIDNAIKYSPQNGRIIVRSLEEEGFIRVEVQDFGPGIPRDQLPMMFRKFSRFLRPIKEQIKGTGLGLYLSKYFIELHGGSIRVQSVEGVGTTFTFTLPLNGEESGALLG